MKEFLRHIRACNNATLPGRHLRVRVGGETVGYVLPDVAALAAEHGATLAGDALEIAPDRLQKVARGLADAGLLWWRDEPFDVRVAPGGPVLGQIDRGALPRFGIRSEGVHLNGLVGEDQIWIGFRSPTKRLDPSKLDHLVAGGIPAGMTPAQTLLKEGAEEASLPASLLREAVPAGTISYAMEREEGLRRDTLHVYDLQLPSDVHPVPGDDEVVRFELWPIDRALDTVALTNQFKFNVNLVLIDLFIRRGLISGDDAATLRAALDAGKDTSDGR